MEYLPGGILTVVLEKARALLKEEIIIGPLGNWMAYALSYSKKNLTLINMSCVPVTLPNRNISSLVQCNLTNRKVK